MRLSLPLSIIQSNNNTTKDSSDESTSGVSSHLADSESVASHYSTDSLSDKEELDQPTIHIWEKDQLKPSKPPTPPNNLAAIKKEIDSDNDDEESDYSNIGEIPRSELSTLIINVPNSNFPVKATIAIKSKVSITHLIDGKEHKTEVDMYDLTKDMYDMTSDNDSISTTLKRKFPLPSQLHSHKIGRKMGYRMPPTYYSDDDSDDSDSTN